MRANPIQELDGKIARIVLWIITASLYLALGENLISKTPVSLILSNIMIAAILTILSATHKKWRTNKLLIRLFFIAFCIVILPITWLNSKGTLGAQPVYMASFIVLITLVLDRLWATILSVVTTCIVALLMLLEYFNLLTFIEVSLPRELILSNLIHYMIVYVMLMGVGIIFKMNYNNFQDEYYRLSVFDDLTQLSNRRHLIKSLNQLVSETQKHHQPFSVLFIDVDCFKLVNDLDGHIVGDLVLQTLGKVIVEGLREYDIGGRYGGDEMMILLPHTRTEDAYIIAERISRTFNQSVKSITTQPVSLSIGIVESNNKSSEEIIRSADEAMYLKKKERAQV